MNIDIRYSCNSCGIKDRVVTIPAREPGQDILIWMETIVLQRLGVDHYRESPLCDVDTLTEVKLPIGAGTDLIGGASKQ